MNNPYELIAKREDEINCVIADNKRLTEKLENWREQVDGLRIKNDELDKLCNDQAATLRAMQCTINRLETRIESLMDIIAIMEFTQSDTEDQAARAIAALQAELADKENAFVAMLQMADSMILG